MTNEQKTLELSGLKGIPDEEERYYNSQACRIYDKCLEMAEWKEQQMIEYLYKNIQSLLKDYGVSEASADITTQLFLANFKQTMKEG